MSSGDQRWLEPLWLASGNPQCSVEFPGPRLYQLRANKAKSNPETQITGKQGSWPVWDSHGSPGTCKGFLCAVWIQFLGQLPFSRDISKGQQEAGHELMLACRGTLQFQPRRKAGSLAGQHGGMSAEGMQGSHQGPMTEALNLISVTYIGTAGSPSRETQSTWGGAEGAAGPGVQERGRL